MQYWPCGPRLDLLALETQNNNISDTSHTLSRQLFWYRRLFLVRLESPDSASLSCVYILFGLNYYLDHQKNILLSPRTQTQQKQNTMSSKNSKARESIRKLEAHEYKKAAQCLAESFGDDEVSTYFTKCDGTTPEKRRELDIKIYEYIVYAHILKGLVLVAGDFEGISCWMPPGQNMDDWWTVLRSGMWRLNFSLGKEGKARYFDEFLPLLHDTKLECLKERDDNSWYLVYIATLPSARGKGYGRALIDYVTEIADKEGLPCYLEATSDLNFAVYKKLGFEYVKSIELKRAENPIPLQIMVREPTKASSAA